MRQGHFLHGLKWQAQGTQACSFDGGSVRVLLPVCLPASSPVTSKKHFFPSACLFLHHQQGALLPICLPLLLPPAGGEEELAACHRLEEMLKYSLPEPSHPGIKFCYSSPSNMSCVSPDTAPPRSLPACCDLRISLLSLSLLSFAAESTFRCRKHVMLHLLKTIRWPAGLPACLDTVRCPADPAVWLWTASPRLLLPGAVLLFTQQAELLLSGTWHPFFLSP